MIRRAHLITNLKSGRGLGARLPELAQRICDQHGYQLVIDPTDGRQALEAASSPDEDSVIIAAGGDGTIRSVAQQIAGHPVRMAVVPTGTFNFFARTHSIPEDPEAALRVALTGAIKKVPLGRVNDQYFLVNASIGHYANTIAAREAHARRFGRRRSVVLLAMVASWCKRPRMLHLQIDAGGSELTLRTPTVFFGNNTLQLRNLGFRAARCTDAEALALVTPKEFAPLRNAWSIARRAVGFKAEDPMRTFCIRRAVIQSNRQSHEVALDGELFHLQCPLKVELVREALQLKVPKES